MEQSNATGGKISAYDSLFTLPLLLVAFVFDVFLLIDGSALLGSQFSQFQPEIEIYLAMDSILLGGTRYIREINISFMSAMIFFVPVFIITVVSVGQIEGYGFASIQTQSLGFPYYITQIILQIFVVTLSEELLFRGLVEKYFGWIPQGILFGLFHISSYQLEGFSWTGVVIAMIFGLVMGYIVKIASTMDRTGDGIAITWGIHAGWNLATMLGVFALGAVF